MEQAKAIDSNGQNGNGKRSVSEDREGKPTSNRQRVDGTENLDIVKMNQIIIHNFVIVNFKFNSRNDTTTFKQNLLRLQRDYSDFESVLVRIDGHQCIVQCCYCQPADFITQNTTNSDRALSIVKHHLDHICHCVNEAWCLKVTRSGGDALRRKDEVIAAICRAPGVANDWRLLLGIFCPSCPAAFSTHFEIERSIDHIRRHFQGPEHERNVNKVGRGKKILQGLEKLHRRYSHFTQRQLWNALFDKFSKDFQVRDPLFLNFQERCFTYKHLEDLEKDLMAYSFPKSDGAIPPLDGGKSNQGGVSPNLPQTFTLDQVQKFSAELRSRANVSFQLPRQDHGAEANRRRSRNTSTDVPSSIPQFNHPTAFHTMAKSSELLEPRLAALESAIQQNVSKEKVMQLLEIRSKDLVKFTRDLVGSLKSRYDKTKEIYKEAASKQESLEKKMIELERNYQFCDQGLTKKLNAIEAASDAQIQTLTQTVRTTGDESLKTAKKSMEFLKERTDAFGEKIQRLERSIGQVQTDTKQPNTVSNEQIELLKKEVRDLECEQTQQQLDVIETVKMELQNQEQSLRESQNAAIQAKVQELVREKLSVFEQHISSMEQRLMSKQGERAAAAETKLRDNLQSSLELRMDSFEEISTKAQKQHIEIEAKEHVQRIEQQIEVKHRNIEEALSKKVDTKLQQQLHSNADEIERHRQTSQHAQKRLEDTLNTKFEDLKQANVQQRDKEKATSTKARLDLEKRQDNLDAYVKHALADSHAEFITAIESMRKDLKTQQDRISDFQEQIIRKDEEIATLKHAFGDDHLGFEAVWEMQVHKEQVDAASSPSLQNKPILAISGKKSTKGPTDEQTSRIGKVAQRIYKLPKSIRSSEKLEAEKPSQGSFVVQPAHPKARKSAALLADSEEDEALPRMSPAKKRASEGPNSEPAAKRTETARANNNSQVVNRIVTPQMLPPMESLGSSGRHGFQPSAASEKESTKLGREHKTAKTNNDSQVVDDDELLINDCIIVDFREISADEAIPPVSKPITPVSEAIIPASEAIDKNSKITKQPAKKGRKPKRTR